MKICPCCQNKYDPISKKHKNNHIIPKWVYKNYIKPNGTNYFKFKFQSENNKIQHSDEYCMELWCDTCEKKSATCDNRAHDLFISDSQNRERESLKTRLSAIPDGGEIDIKYADVVILQKWIVSLIVRDAIAMDKFNLLPSGLHDSFMNDKKYSKMYIVFSTVPLTEYPLNDFNYSANFGFYRSMICGIAIFIPMVNKKYKILNGMPLKPNNTRYKVSSDYAMYVKQFIPDR